MYSIVGVPEPQYIQYEVLSTIAVFAILGLHVVVYIQ